MQTISISGANGLFSLGNHMSSASRVGSSVTDSKLIKIENISGSLFPIAVGNRIKYDLVIRSDTTTAGRHYTDVTTMKLSCGIARQLDAKSFHPNLSGHAYLKECDYQTFNVNNPSANSKSQLNDVFFDAFGYWVTADPVDSQPNIIRHRITSFVGKNRITTDASYVLKSYSLGFGK
jgi:hypothetical protein